MNPAVHVLATQRLVKLINEDEITRPIRMAIYSWAESAPEFSFRERVASAIDCKACASVWAAGAVLVATRFRAGRWLVAVLALSEATLTVEAMVRRLER